MTQAIFEFRETIADNITTFWFRPEKSLDYTAGQFIEMTLPHPNPDNRGINRWFTLSSSPTDELLAITTKHAASPSTFKSALYSLKTGDSVTMSSAMGDFVLPMQKTTPLIFVAGGIGITPVHSMLKWLVDTKQSRQVSILYAALSETDLAFNMFLRDNQFDVNYFITESDTQHATPNHIIRTDDIQSAIAKNTDPLVYLSGPEEMVEVLVEELKDNGVKNSRLVTDYFPGYGSI